MRRCSPFRWRSTRPDLLWSGSFPCLRPVDPAALSFYSEHSAANGRATPSTTRTTYTDRVVRVVRVEYALSCRGPRLSLDSLSRAAEIEFGIVAHRIVFQGRSYRAGEIRDVGRFASDTSGPVPALRHTAGRASAVPERFETIEEGPLPNVNFLSQPREEKPCLARSISRKVEMVRRLRGGHSYRDIIAADPSHVQIALQRIGLDPLPPL